LTATGIEEYGVAREHQRQGLGRMLVSHIVEEAFREECSVTCTATSSKSMSISETVQFCSSRCNIADQIGFFRKLGLEPVAATKGKVDGVSIKGVSNCRQSTQAYSYLQYTNMLLEIETDQDEE
jgi:predicted GNAT family acetyltransferase